MLPEAIRIFKILLVSFRSLLLGGARDVNNVEVSGSLLLGDDGIT
jgi:hypothetical protein